MGSPNSSDASTASHDHDAPALIDSADEGFSSPPSSPQSAPSDFAAPLGSEFSDVSLDGTSVCSFDNLRPEKPEDVTEEDKEAALRIKSEANKSFAASDYQTSVDLYTQSINRNPFDSTVWCNRCACRLKREEFGLAISDATRAIELNPKYVKAYYRRALSNLSILKPKASMVDFRKVIALEPNNINAKAQLDSTIKLVRRLDFEKAIAGKEEEPVSVRCRKQLQESMEVEKDYDGPILDQITLPNGEKEARPTIEFVRGMLEHFKAGKLLPKRYVWQIVLGCQTELLKHDSLVDVEIPQGQTCDVVGDTHGQFFDVLKLLELTGGPSPTHTLVANGDFVDRGSWSCEVVLTWFAFKWLYPRNCFLNRGNHETSDMNKVYGFEGETKKKYAELTFKLFEEAFIALPVATLITASQRPKPRSDALPPKIETLGPNGTKRFFVVHGGIFSKDSVGLDDVRKIDRLRIKQPTGDSVFGEALWADPQTEPGRGPSKRGIGLGFGPDVSRRFTEKNKVTAIIRSHEVREGGYSSEHDGLCLTVFSSPNYVDQVGNLAAFARISDNGEIDFTTFKESPHPNIKPMAYAGGFASSFM